jgi:transposase-like protein
MSIALSGRYLSFAEREEIGMLSAQGVGVREIARRISRRPSTVSREPTRNAATRGGKLEYRASVARGMSVRDIPAFLAEQYGTDVSPDFISSVTDEVMEEVGAWQQRPLEVMYPVIFFDALRVKIR